MLLSNDNLWSSQKAAAFCQGPVTSQSSYRNTTYSLLLLQLDLITPLKPTTSHKLRVTWIA